MNPTLTKALIALLPTGILLLSSVMLFAKHRSLPSVLQLVGAAGLVVVALSHICEGLHFMTWMGWGMERSAGHYVNLSSVVLGLIFFPVGYLVMSLRA